MTRKDLQRNVAQKTGALVAALRRTRPQPLTQSQLAKGTQGLLTRSAIANIESGRQRVAVYQLYAIADALGVSVHDLLPAMSDVLGRGQMTETERRVLEKLVPEAIKKGDA